MKKKLVKRAAALLTAATIFTASAAPFAYAEAPETPVILEMQEPYEELPPYYNAMEEGYATGIKKQTVGNCWAYATLSSIETNLLKQGIMPDRTALDLSENQLTAAMYTRRDDPLHNTAGDMNYSEDIDGHLTWAAQILAGGLPLADEQEYSSRGEGHQFDTDLNVADFWSCAFIPITEQDLKRAIYQYGSVSIAFWSWYHGIALLGWDNSYTDSWVEDSHGVFLAKDSGFVNTWEVGRYESNYYIDYTDTEYYYEGDQMPEFWEGDRWPELFDAVAYEYRGKDTYDNVYLYDGSAFSGQVEAEKAAAVFEAKAGTGDQAEQIVSATLPLASLDTTAAVQIYTDLKDPNDPESGTPLFEPGREPTIHADYSGMYSVDFREWGKTVTLHQGELFSVVMALPKGGSVLTACDGTYFETYTKENIEQGQTFFYTDGWTDGLDLSHTARLHVQTKMVPVSELPPSHVHSFGEDWKTDKNSHWKECACGDKTDEAIHAKTWNSDTTRHWAKCDICGWEDAGKADHNWNSGTVTLSPTCTEAGTKTYACTVCQGVKSEKIAATGHTPGEWEVEAPAAVGREGLRVKRCTVCRAELQREAIPKLKPSSPGPSTPGLVGPGPSVWENPFIDVKESAWYYGAVKYTVGNGLFYGTSGTAFSPNDDMTRGMLATILYRLAKEPETAAENLFSDVADGRYYSKAIAWAAENKIAAGYGNNLFGPEDSITREQLAAILWRYAGCPESAGSLDKFTDGSKTAGYAVPALQWAVERKIISGRGNGVLDPTGKATRAEAAAMLMRCREAL